MKKDIEKALKETIIQGANLPFWTEGLKRVLEMNIKSLEKDILDSDDLSKTVEVSARDLFRMRRNIMKELLDFPAKLAEKDAPLVDVPSFDPYFPSPRLEKKI